MIASRRNLSNRCLYATDTLLHRKIGTYPNFRPVTSHQLGCLKTSLAFLRPRECDKSLCWVVPASCCEHCVLSMYRLGLFGKRVGTVPLTNLNISRGGGFDEPRKDLKPSHKPIRMHTNQPLGQFERAFLGLGG